MKNVKCTKCHKELTIKYKHEDYGLLQKQLDGEYQNIYTRKDVITFSIMAKCEECNISYALTLPIADIEILRGERDEL